MVDKIHSAIRNVPKTPKPEISDYESYFRQIKGDSKLNHIDKVFQDFSHMRNATKILAQFKSSNIPLVRKEIEIILESDSTKKWTSYLDLRSELYLVFNSLPPAVQETTNYLMLQFKIAEFCVVNTSTLHSLENPNKTIYWRLLFNHSSVGPLNPIARALMDICQSEGGIPSEHREFLQSEMSKDDDQYQYSFLLPQPAENYELTLSRVSALRPFLSMIGATDKAAIFVSLVKFFISNTNQVFLDPKFQDFLK